MKAWVLLLLIVLFSHHVFAQDSNDSVRQITLNHIIGNDSLSKVLRMIRDLKLKKVESERVAYYSYINGQSPTDLFNNPIAVKTISFTRDINPSKSNLILTKSTEKKLTFEDVSICVFVPVTIEESVYVTTRIDYDGLNWFVLFRYDSSLKLLSIKYFSGAFDVTD